MAPLTASATSDERRRAVLAASDWLCAIGPCRRRANYVTADHRPACGVCSTPERATTGAANC